MSYPVRGFGIWDADLYVVMRASLIKVEMDGTMTVLGTLFTTEGPAYILNNGIELAVCDGTYLYQYDGTTFAHVSDAALPNLSSMTYQDGYMIATEKDSGRMRISDLYDADAWDSLDFTTAEAQPDNALRVLSNMREVYVFGADTVEPFWNSGAEFPFVKRSDGFMEIGIGAAESAATDNANIFWLSQKGQVVMGVGYRGKVVSTPQLERRWATYSTIADAIGFTFTMDGYTFYALTFPTGDETWVLNTNKGLWHKWSSWPYFCRHRANCYTYFNRMHLIGDFDDGRIYELDKDNPKDDNHHIKRVGTIRAISQNKAPLSHHQFRLQFNHGAGFLDQEFWRHKREDEDWVEADFTYDGKEETWTAAALGSGSGAGTSDLAVLGDWYDGYRPTGVRITFTGPSDFTLGIVDAGGTTSQASYESLDEKTIDLGNDDLEKLTFGGYNTELVISNIEFFDSDEERTEGQCMLRYSDDGGKTWSTELWDSIGAKGEYDARSEWNRLGQAEDRIYEFTITDPIKIVTLGAYLRATAGEA